MALARTHRALLALFALFALVLLAASPTAAQEREAALPEPAIAPVAIAPVAVAPIAVESPWPSTASWLIAGSAIAGSFLLDDEAREELYLERPDGVGGWSGSGTGSATRSSRRR